MIVIASNDFKRFLINSESKMEMVDNNSKNIGRIKIFNSREEANVYLDSLLYYGFYQKIVDINPDNLLKKNGY